MVKLEFRNARVKDDGYGLSVNGKSLEEIISTALGTKVGDKKAGYGSDLPAFDSNCCDIILIINPQPVTTHIKDGNYEYGSVEDLERGKYERYKAENPEGYPEE